MLEHEALIRGGSFFVAFALLSVLERTRPLRAAMPVKLTRQLNNLALLTCNTLVLRAVFPTALLAVAVYAAAQGHGVFNGLDGPAWLSVLICVVALDLAVYWQHRLLHAYTPLWRLHRVHHSDPDLDATTGFRFHPVEILLSAAYKAVIVLALGAPAAAVLLFETLLNLSSMFNHSNLDLGARCERLLRPLVVTPRMHWVHHSEIPRESRSNYGFCLSVWDRLFGSYAAAPAAGYAAMRIGVAGYHGPEALRLGGMLKQPFAPDQHDPDDYVHPDA